VQRHSFAHLSNPELLRAAHQTIQRDCVNTAELLALLAEIDSRKLYLPAGFSSMFEFCVRKLGMSEDVACKRIGVARKARKLPAIFAAVADGRVHLSGVHALVPHLTPTNVDELLAAASHHTKAEIELMLAHRFPREDVRTRIRAVPSRSAQAQPAPTVEFSLTSDAALSAPGRMDSPVVTTSSAPERMETLAAPALSVPGRIATPAVPAPPPSARPKIAPLAPRRFSLQLTMSQELHDKLRRAQALLGHAVPSGDVPQVLERALDALIAELERRKFAATSRPKKRSQPSSNPSSRYIPAEVRRAVSRRDQDRCTFVSHDGRRCSETRGLEFDHVQPFALGGTATVDGLRLRCRAHNQYEADRAFGEEFMNARREKRREQSTEHTGPTQDVA
jgi:hypothetical protein